MATVYTILACAQENLYLARHSKTPSSSPYRPVCPASTGAALMSLRMTIALVSLGLFLLNFGARPRLQVEARKLEHDHPPTPTPRKAGRRAETFLFPQFQQGASTATKITVSHSISMISYTSNIPQPEISICV